MEIYVAISDFTPPIVDGSQNILTFQKGDTFEIFDCHKTEADWWGARALKTNIVGYVPSRYMQYEERRVGSLLPTNYKNQKETSLKRLSDIQNSPNHRAPEDMYNDNLEPEPDYNVEADEVDMVTMETVVKKSEGSSSQLSEDVLIQPKKLPNPCVESPTRQALHKELLLNYKRGVNVLEKPELNKVLQNRRETQKRKEWEQQAKEKRTSLEMKLEKQATRLKEEEMKTIPEKEEVEKTEFQKAFAKVSQKASSKVK